MGGPTLREELAGVVAHGAPAQQAEARRLVNLPLERPNDAEAVAAAEQLIDAYLHDPYLERG
jgi:hypothetical protein